MSEVSMQNSWGGERESVPYEEPQGEIEAALAEIWAQTFGLERVSRTENYFGLGGNSLRAMALMQKASARFDLELPVVILFQFPTLSEMAEVIQSLLSDDAAGEGVEPCE